MKKAITIIVVIILMILVFMAYLGVFSKVELAEKEVGPFAFAYEDYVGDYAKTGPVFDEVYKTLLAGGIETTQGLGIYYDDPDVVAKENLRSRVGSIITKKQEEEADKLGINVKLMTVDSFDAVVSEFPYRNKMSIIVGLMKVYPEMMEYMDENGIQIDTAYELYDMEGGKILYMMKTVQ